MKLLQIFKSQSTPSIFADLVVETAKSVKRYDVDEQGWLDRANLLLAKARRVGLQLRWERRPRVWIQATDPVRYFSRVIGRISEEGQTQTRVACLTCGDVVVWLHRNGQVEIGPEPTVK